MLADLKINMYLKYMVSVEYNKETQKLDLIGKFNKQFEKGEKFIDTIINEIKKHYTLKINIVSLAECMKGVESD